MKSISPIENLLSRLDGVKNTPKGWKACCPAHNDKNPSLSIAQGDDGRVLLKCWAGCEALDIVHSLELELSDLFERNYYRRPDERQQIRPNWRDMIQLLFLDATVIKLCSDKILSAGLLANEDLESLEKAYKSISAIVATTEALAVPGRVEK